jgi:uncharacterized protein YcfL
MKKYSLIALLVLSALLLVGCTANDALGRFERSASSTIETTTDLDQSSSLDINEQEVNAIESSTSYLLSSVTLELTVQEKIEYARSLYTSIALLHANNIILHEGNKADFATLKTSIQAFRDLGATLSEEDKALIISEREAVVASRTAVLETKGDIRMLLIELQGKFNLENIDLIIENFEEIHAILTIRNTHLLLVQEKLSSVQSIVDTYLV